ncbi:MAG: DNA mismatch repair endonuclease MutL [Bacteroidales bacterium]|nr:DNA mismatch repair endonuclease MutL [Bacteroidales bacterium]
MSKDYIQILPESIANQIAAGEVIQRPASAVKELVENAVDAHARNVGIYLKEAGKNQIQVIDDGIGMSPADAKIAFARHATSKIREAKDLFEICTLGFRGEALASIAAIAEVSLKTRREEDELGTRVEIAASTLIGQEPVQCPVGTNFTVKNLFFNTPARRKFLRTNQTELKHVLTEFERIALSRPDIGFKLHHNTTEIYNLPPASLPQRITHLFGKGISNQIISINADTQIVKVSGFVCKPEYAKKVAGEQFIFVNNRYVRHALLHKAILNAFSQLIHQEAIPSYFIFLDTDPENIDVNIHPTKTEVKFVNEQAVFQILHAAVKEALGKFNVIPSLDFDMDRSIEIPAYGSQRVVIPPSIDYDPKYNPFDSQTGGHQPSSFRPEPPAFLKDNLSNWDTLYKDFESDQQKLPLDTEKESTKNNLPGNTIFQFKLKYIMTPTASGLMVIDQKRAHERILYEQFVRTLANLHTESQQMLYPKVIDLSPGDFALLSEIAESLKTLGFDVQPFGGYSVALNAYPAILSTEDPEALFMDLLARIRESEETGNHFSEKIARALAKAGAIPYGKALNAEEMNFMIDHLFACETPGFTPGGKTIVIIVQTEEIEKKF